MAAKTQPTQGLASARGQHWHELSEALVPPLRLALLWGPWLLQDGPSSPPLAHCSDRASELLPARFPTYWLGWVFLEEGWHGFQEGSQACSLLVRRK